MTSAPRPRVMFYVQHLLGVGHQTRAAAIAKAIQARGMEVCYVSGGFDDLALDLGGATRVQLPPARTADDSFSILLDETGKPVDSQWEANRRNALLAAYRTHEPDLILIESYPFGRRRFRFELNPLLEVAHGRSKIAASVRDILVARDDPNRTRWIVDLVRRYFDAVIVHGDPALIEFGATFPGASKIEDRLRYSGYVAVQPPARAGRRRDLVVVSAGGGAVGRSLLETAIAARPLTRLAEAPWYLITGPNLPENDRKRLVPPSGVTVDTFRDDFHDILNEAAVSISQAGYNTVMDLCMTRTRAVLVPFERQGETEQIRRAEIMAARGVFQVVSESELCPVGLAKAVDRALDMPSPEGVEFMVNGAANTAEIIAELISGR